MRNRVIGSELFDADRQTNGHTDERTERHYDANSRFRNVANASKIIK